jgi:hypothetical protein
MMRFWSDSVSCTWIRPCGGSGISLTKCVMYRSMGVGTALPARTGSTPPTSTWLPRRPSRRPDTQKRRGGVLFGHVCVRRCSRRHRLGRDRVAAVGCWTDVCWSGSSESLDGSRIIDSRKLTSRRDEKAPPQGVPDWRQIRE